MTDSSGPHLKMSQREVEIYGSKLWHNLNIIHDEQEISLLPVFYQDSRIFLTYRISHISLSGVSVSAFRESTGKRGHTVARAQPYFEFSVWVPGSFRLGAWQAQFGVSWGDAQGKEGQSFLRSRSEVCTDSWGQRAALPRISEDTDFYVHLVSCECIFSNSRTMLHRKHAVDRTGHHLRVHSGLLARGLGVGGWPAAQRVSQWCSPATDALVCVYVSLPIFKK